MPAPQSNHARLGSVSSTLVSSDVRTRNLSIVLRELSENGPNARSDLARSTGLTRGAITALTGILSAAGLIEESESVQGEGSGRPRTLLAVSAESIAVVALQIDADQVILIAEDLGGATLLRLSQHHGRPIADPDAVLDVAGRVLLSALRSLESDGRRAASLVVIVFAPVGGAPRIVLADTDLGWGPVDVLDGLARRVPGLPLGTTLVSDATVAARAEQRALGGVPNLLYLKSNSGIGGAIIADGRIIEGAHAVAGAVGHIAIDFDGTPCDCGQRGCLVTVAGPDVLLERAGLGRMLAERGLTEALDEFVRQIRLGEAEASAAFADATRWIGRAVAVLRMTSDPEVIVLGGYWAELADVIADACAEPLQLALPRDELTPRVIAGVCGADAALRGALWQVRHELMDDPLALAH